MKGQRDEQPDGLGLKLNAAWYCKRQRPWIAPKRAALVVACVGIRATKI